MNWLTDTYQFINDKFSILQQFNAAYTENYTRSLS